MAASGKARSGPHPMMLTLQRQLKEIKRQKEGAPARKLGGNGMVVKVATVKAPAQAVKVAMPEGATTLLGRGPEGAARAAPARQGRPVAAPRKGGRLSVRLKPTSGLAIRRLGVPLRGGAAAAAAAKGAPGAALGRRRSSLMRAGAAGVAVGRRRSSLLRAGEPAPRKRPRHAGVEGGVAAAWVRSALAVKQQVVSEDDEDWQPLVDVRAEPFRENEERAVARPVRPSVKDERGSNILRGLLGHLASASQRLSFESGDQNAALPGRMLKAKKEEAEDGGDDVGRRRRGTAELRAWPVEPDGQENEMRELQKRLESHYSNMKNFIRTQAEPTIFYLPVKHTPETKLALQETRLAIEQKIHSLGSHLQSEHGLEESDDGGDYEAASSPEASPPGAEEEEGEDDEEAEEKTSPSPEARRAGKRKTQESSSS